MQALMTYQQALARQRMQAVRAKQAAFKAAGGSAGAADAAEARNQDQLLAAQLSAHRAQLGKLNECQWMDGQMSGLGKLKVNKRKAVKHPVRHPRFPVPQLPDPMYPPINPACQYDSPVLGQNCSISQQEDWVNYQNMIHANDCPRGQSYTAFPDGSHQCIGTPPSMFHGISGLGGDVGFSLMAYSIYAGVGMVGGVAGYAITKKPKGFVIGAIALAGALFAYNKYQDSKLQSKMMADTVRMSATARPALTGRTILPQRRV